jgi:hypothetical protein
MARAAKPQKNMPRSDRASDEPRAAAEIDAQEMERAKRDPIVKDFARRADKTLRSLKRRGTS